MVRALMDEVFGKHNCCGLIVFAKTSAQASLLLSSVSDYLLWYAADRTQVSYRQLYKDKVIGGEKAGKYAYVEFPNGDWRALTPAEGDDPSAVPAGGRVFAIADITSAGSSGTSSFVFEFEGKSYVPPRDTHWKTSKTGMERLASLGRILATGTRLMFKRYIDDFPAFPLTHLWTDTSSGASTRDPKVYAVQTRPLVVERCIHMTTAPGQLVFDLTCGSGTTASCAERLGRRWVTCDTSRVAVNVARQRLLAATFEHFKTRNGKVSGDFLYKTVNRVMLKGLANNLEPERVELFDQPESDKDAIRVCGPFEIMSLGRYSVEDWKGYVVREPGVGEAAKLENYIEVICRLYRKDAAIQGATGLVHAVAETEEAKIAISVGPLSGRVTAKQINDAVQDALASSILEVHVLGWAFEANVNEIKQALEKRGRVKVELIMIRPDTLAEGLKATQPEMLFSPLALPDIEVEAAKNDEEKQLRVTLKGVALFDRKRRTTEYKAADSGYVSAWYLDEDYDGDCFVDCQMFFDFKKSPNIKAALKAEVDPEEFTLKLDSEPFPVRGYKRIAVKVVDVYGNESVVVRDLA